MSDNKIDESEQESIENEEDNFHREKPSYDPKDVDIVSEQNSLATIIEMIKDKVIDMNPDFQRKQDLWKENIMSRLIESILLRLPLPAFYFDASNNEKWLVVDGLQRLSTLKKFVIDKKLVLSNLIIYTELNGKSYDDLDARFKRTMARHQLTTHLIRAGTPKRVKYDIFRRINTGGLILSPQEIRHTLNQEKQASQQSPADYLKKLVESSKFKDIVKSGDDRMQAREWILRYLAFSITPYHKYEEEAKNLTFTEFLDKAMEILAKLNEETLEQLENKLWKSLEICRDIFGDHVFSKSIIGKGNQRQNAALFEVWTVSVAQLTDEEIKKLLLHKKKLVDEFINLLQNNEDFLNSVSRSTISRNFIKTRFSTVESIIKDTLYD